jgi:hypothetical protein
MFSLILPVLLSQLPLARGFAPNPQEHALKQGDAVSLEGFATCAGVPSGAVVSRDPALTFEVEGGISHLAFQLSDRNAWLVARTAGKELVCSKDQVLTVDVKPGKLELFVVTPSSAVESKDMKVKVLDTDGLRELPLNIKRVAMPLSLEAELMSESVPVAELEVTAAAENLEWKLGGGASEVWVTSLMPGSKAVKAPPSLPVGKYAVWITGAKGAFTLSTAKPAEPVKTAEAAAPAPAPTPAPVAEAAPAPAAPAPAETVESHLLTGVDLETLRGWSREAQAARKKLFMEVPAEQLVFAAADGEALVLTSIEGKDANVLSADGAEVSMRLDELSTKPGSGPRVRMASLPDDVPFEALTTAGDPKVKSYEKTKKWTETCLEKYGDDEDPAKKCNVARLESAKKKLDTDLRKAFKKKHAAELAQIERRLKALFDKTTAVATSRRRSRAG